MLNKKLNPWELCNNVVEVLVDIGLDPMTPKGEELSQELLSIMTNRRYVGPLNLAYEFEIQVHFTSKGFQLFMEHIRARAKQIGEELLDVEVAPMETMSDLERISWRGVPGIEFFTLEYTNI